MKLCHMTELRLQTIWRKIMAHSFKRNGQSIMLGFTSLALTAFAGQAMAQDYSVKLKRTADISVSLGSRYKALTF